MIGLSLPSPLNSSFFPWLPMYKKGGVAACTSQASQQGISGLRRRRLTNEVGAVREPHGSPKAAPTQADWTRLPAPAQRNARAHHEPVLDGWLSPDVTGCWMCLGVHDYVMEVEAR